MRRSYFTQQQPSSIVHLRVCGSWLLRPIHRAASGTGTGSGRAFSSTSRRRSCTDITHASVRTQKSKGRVAYLRHRTSSCRCRAVSGRSKRGVCGTRARYSLGHLQRRHAMAHVRVTSRRTWVHVLYGPKRQTNAHSTAVAFVDAIAQRKGRAPGPRGSAITS